MKKFLKRIPQFYKKILVFFLISRLILIVIGLLTRQTLRLEEGQSLIFSANSLIDMLAYWDSGFYVEIAQSWYKYVDWNDMSKAAILDKRNFAFFPLYPALMLIFSKILFIDVVTAGIVVSNLCLYYAGIYLFKITKFLHDENIAYKAVILLFFFPGSFFYSSVLTEGLLLFLLLLVYYLALKRKWLMAGLTGIFLAMTKLIGVFIIIPLIIEYFWCKKNNGEKFDFKISFLFFPLIGTGLYLYLNYYYTGSVFTFNEIQSLYWGRETGIFLLHMIEGMSTQNPFLIFNYWYMVVILIIVLYGWFELKLKPSLIVLSLILILVPLSTSLWSLVRYMSVIFPIYIILAQILSTKHELRNTVYYAIIFICSGFLALHWALGSQIVM